METITYIRRIIFCILRTTLITLRRFRKQKGLEKDVTTPLYEVDISVSEAVHIGDNKVEKKMHNAFSFPER